MHLHYRNVNHAFTNLVECLQKKAIPTTTESSRNGPVIQVTDPITITYEKPLERVLFNSARDCNPFFHVYEALWMLSGRNDVDPLAYYAPNIANYSDNGETFNGAYGYRWRQNGYWKGGAPFSLPDDWVDVDQLRVIVKHLKEKPNSRRVVLQMWNVENDLMKIDSGKDVCCNLSVLFSLRGFDERVGKDCPNGILGSHMFNSTFRDPTPPTCVNCGAVAGPIYLDATILNRSNDLIWGALGANYVHFSFLQEYMAAQLEVEVGKMHVFSNNLHVYTENNSGFKPEEWLADEVGDLYTKSAASNLMFVPLVRDPVMFEKELPKFVNRHSEGCSIDDRKDWAEPFFAQVAEPMLCAFHHHKAREYHSALAACGDIQATDWRLAATNWIAKRRNNYEAKQVKVGE